MGRPEFSRLKIPTQPPADLHLQTGHIAAGACLGLSRCWMAGRTQLADLQVCMVAQCLLLAMLWPGVMTSEPILP